MRASVLIPSVLGLWVCGLPGVGAMGQSGGGEDGLAAESVSVGDQVEGAGAGGRRVVVRLPVRGLHYFTTDLDDDEASTGDVSVSRFGLNPSVEIPVGDVSSLTLSGEFTYSFYDFDGTGIFDDDNELMADGYEAGLGVQWSSVIGGNWTYFVGGGARMSAEAGADLSEAWTWRGFGGVGYRFSERLVRGGGVAFSSELEDDALVVPVLSASWQISDDWTFAAGGGPASAWRTLGATLTWQASPDLAVSLTGAWDYREFRLDDDGPVPDGVMSDSRVDVILAVNWGVAQGVRLRVEGGVSAWQEYEFVDDDGDEVLDTDSDPTGFVGGGLVFEF